MDAYMAYIGVFHQIHCLYALRKTTFRDYSEQPTNPPIHQPRLEYVRLACCFDILMGNLM